MLRKLIKIVIIVAFIIIGVFKLTEWYLESEFETILNNNPDRNYNISYKQFDLHTFFTGITLKEVNITPVNKTSGTVINGTVDFAELNGFEWLKFLFEQQVEVDALVFNQPKFVVNSIDDKKEEKRAANLQNLFGDILSRVDLREFQLHEGSVKLLEKDSTLKGQIHRIDINATEIKTDSIQLSHIIPFYLGNLEVSIDSAYYNINSYTKVTMGALEYSIAQESLRIQDLALKYDKNWVTVSENREFQDDVIEFELKEVSVTKMNYASSFWTNLDIEAQSMDIDGLHLSLKRNKNLRRSPDKAKPLFNGMVNKIPYNIDLDSINIKNSTILYGELGAGRHQTGIIAINAINGSITQLTTFKERKQKLKEFRGSFAAKLNGSAKMQISLEIPYQSEYFDLHTSIGPMPFKALNKSLVPLLGVEFNDGELKRLDFKMQSNYYESKNRLEMDYDNMQLSIYEEENDGSEHKKDFLSSIANVAIRHHNLPDKHGYITADYTTKRNIYRSPFQHIVAGVLDGTKQIVPAKVVQTFINSKQKKKDRKKREKRQKNKKRKRNKK
jgi:hypothetical protein